MASVPKFSGEEGGEQREAKAKGKEGKIEWEGKGRENRENRENNRENNNRKTIIGKTIVGKIIGKIIIGKIGKAMLKANLFKYTFHPSKGSSFGEFILPLTKMQL